MDDLVYSGAGSGCKSDDEDECPPLPENGSGDDDLITPVYVPPTKPPATKAPQKASAPVGNKSSCDDEEEDCFPGSGSGEPTEETTITSQKTGKETNFITKFRLHFIESLQSTILLLSFRHSRI